MNICSIIYLLFTWFTSRQKEEEERRNKIAAMAAVKAAKAAISANVVLPEETKSKLFPVVPPIKPVISPSNDNDKTYTLKDP